MHRLKHLIPILLCLIALTGPVSAQQLSALARLTGDGAQISEHRDGLDLSLQITQTIPWRVFTLTDPPRVVLDFSELSWDGLTPLPFLSASEKVLAMQMGLFRPGWSRMVLELSEPMLVDSAGMETQGGQVRVSLRLSATSAEEFAAHAGTPQSALFVTPETDAEPVAIARARQVGDRPLVVVLDPGHGGIDPGAEREGVIEADLMLGFARTLKEVLTRDGFIVVLTRDDDRFVPLEERVTIARRAGADAFLSLHADVVAQGRASGASVYTLSQEATDIASRKLAERHDRADLLAGVDLSRQDDSVAFVLMDLARTETAPRSERLADALVQGIHAATQSTYKTPRLQAGFSVLKAPDIPSVLIELGFLSSARDRKNLTSPEWRANATRGIRDALRAWAIEDAAEAARLRQ